MKPGQPLLRVIETGGFKISLEYSFEFKRWYVISKTKI